MSIHYFANQIYQLSYAWPIYNAIGGSFLVRKRKTYLKFKRYLRGSAKAEKSSFLGTPPIRKRNLKNISDLSGVLVSQSNSRLHNNPAISRTVFIGHGTGDKKYGGRAHTLESYDYLFISGPKHMEKLKDSGLEIPENRLVKVGNIRFDEYIRPAFSRLELMKRMGIPEKEMSRKNVLYAPTWKWGNGTLRKYAKLFMREITREHNLIVRPHHFDAHLIPWLKTWSALNGLKNVYFSNPNRLSKNDTMQDFLVSDVLVSDTSSVLYEYLVSGKPVIVVNTDFTDLHTMPDSMNIMKAADFWNGSGSILEVVNRNLANASDSARYTEMLQNCFYFNDGRSVQRAADFIVNLGEKIPE